MAHLHSVYLLPELLKPHLLGLQLQATGEVAQSHLHPCLYVYLAQGLMIGSLAAPHLQPLHVVSLSESFMPYGATMHSAARQLQLLAT